MFAAIYVPDFPVEAIVRAEPELREERSLHRLEGFRRHDGRFLLGEDRRLLLRSDDQRSGASRGRRDLHEALADREHGPVRPDAEDEHGRVRRHQRTVLRRNEDDLVAVAADDRVRALREQPDHELFVRDREREPRFTTPP